MELLQLRYFFDSAVTENFAKTAEKYMVPPSSVSATIKRLERELGCQLFDRHSNRITLNENGRKLQRSLGVVFDELEQVATAFSSKASDDDTEIKLLVRSIRSRMTDAIIEYREKHPHVRFKMVLDFAENDYDGYDLIIDEESDVYVGFEKFELCSLRVRMKVSSSSPLCGRNLTMKQLRHHPFVTMGEHSNLHRILLKACKNAGFLPNIIVETNDAQCYGKCIAAGIGIGLARENPNDTSTQTTYLSVTDFQERQTFYGYYKGKSASSHVQEFIEFLKCRRF